MAGTATEAVQLSLREIELALATVAPQIQEDLKGLIDAVLDRPTPASDKPALLFLLAYRQLNDSHDLRRIPVGWRPADKHLCAALTQLGYTLHSNITAFGENMGAKGNAPEFDLYGRARTGAVLRTLSDRPAEIGVALKYVAWRFKRSFSPPVEIAPLSPDALTFTRAFRKVHALLLTESGGHFPQFLVAAVLRTFHERWNTGHYVLTQHPHASDKSGSAAGDVEIVNTDGTVVEAYEVTVRPDWVNRRPDILKKMARANLSSYHVLCLTDVDPRLSTPESLDVYMSEMGQDISVVDVRAFLATHILGFSREMRKRVFEHLEKYIRDPKVSGVPEYIELLKHVLES
jgi:hypothetical protein